MKMRPAAAGAATLAAVAFFTFDHLSPLFATRRTAQIESCHLQPSTAPGPTYAPTADLVMDFVVVDGLSDRVIRGLMPPDESVTGANYRYACPAGQRIDVWWDSRYPAVAYRDRWQMIPWVFIGMFAFLGYCFIRAAQYRAPEVSGGHEERRVQG